jgi:aspartyl-tRNA(Asn)/glutamyl-tRNA(Gln) amidotransferase subunit B
MRGKEGSADYRYFPDPDLPPLIISDEIMAECEHLPELPDQKRERLKSEYSIKDYDARVITAEIEMANFFEKMIELGASAKNSVSWLTVELLGRLKNGLTISTSPVDSTKLATLVMRIEDSTISGAGAKQVLDYLMENDISVDDAIEKLNLKQVSDDSVIVALIDEVIISNPKQAEQYRGGKEALFGFFVGQVMKVSKGSANPAKVNELLKERLNRVV